MKRIDQIRQMSSEELAKVLYEIGGCRYRDDCEGCFLDGAGCYRVDMVEHWLEEEVQEYA